MSSCSKRFAAPLRLFAGEADIGNIYLISAGLIVEIRRLG
jgi:hypothetical protein